MKYSYDFKAERNVERPSPLGVWKDRKHAHMGESSLGEGDI
jgi:hypothetical protein